jgi:hypothetical protein
LERKCIRTPISPEGFALMSIAGSVLISGNAQVWLSTFEQVTTSPFAAIWICPADYRAVTRGTPFDPEQRRQPSAYRRQSEREALVEGRIIKRCLLSETTLA